MQDPKEDQEKKKTRLNKGEEQKRAVYKISKAAIEGKKERCRYTSVTTAVRVVERGHRSRTWTR
ncbi:MULTISPECIES: hypothetical protein [Candidatus Ichthyocystis]|uniref:hypothetical protein n=1 Tax=Candidatus Ichthyocystis TaxID=2929841 RepID=UPI000B85E385|nr:MULTISPECIES: hypothetical protein [Ichthyocystis]